jgi:4-hydroxybenzoate polyprenyltransferase
MTIDPHVTRNGTTRSRASRIFTYLSRMFPLQVMGTFAACHFLAVWFALQALDGLAPVRLTWASVRGIATVALFLLLMRLYDELKDADTDIRLGRAGDPWYRDRPLVTGAVRIEDVKLLRWLVTASLVVINLRTGFAWASIAFWIVLGVTWLSFKWFFWPRMSERLLVALVTHNPISLLLSGYIVGLFADTFGAEHLHASVFPLLVGLWLPIAAWETSRKIRAPEDETTYRTYSRELGWKIAPFLPAACVAVSAGLLLLVSRIAGLGVVFSIVIAATGAVVVFRCMLYRMSPTRRHANLKPWAILFATVANAGLAGAAARAGLAW